MQTNDNILELVKEKDAEAARATQRGVILQPGAIGDCILTLPLAKFMKDSLCLGGIDVLGHTDYISILPGRTCVDGVRSIDSMDLHRLFVEARTFDLADGDPLVNAFADYAWIVSFLGEPNSNFEQNLIFTANCSHSAEVITLSMKPSEGFESHLTDFYKQQFIDQSGLSLEPLQVQSGDCLIKAVQADVNSGRALLEEMNVGFSEKLVVIQPGSGGLHKCWHLDNFLALAGELGSKGLTVIFLLGPAELARLGDTAPVVLLHKIEAAGAKCLMNLPLTQVLGLLSCADAFIGNDSGITHLAAGLGLRTLVVFGPTKPAVYKPIGPAVTAFVSGDTAFAEETSTSLQQELLDVLLA